MISSYVGQYLAWLSLLISGQTFTFTPKPMEPTSSASAEDEYLNYFDCDDITPGRYPHTTDCTKYFMCIDSSHVVRYRQCPADLHFSPTAHLCTLPQDAGCEVQRTRNTAGPDDAMEVRFRNLYKAAEEPNLVVYFDHNVSPRTTWPIDFTRTMWKNVLQMYGNFGPENRLHLVLRGNATLQNSTTFLDNGTNVIKVGSADWSVESRENTDLIVWNMAQIITDGAKGVRYPFPENNWTDIFVYDLYARASRTADKDRWASNVLEKFEGEMTTNMFAEWYLPVYEMYGGGNALNQFMNLRERHFLKDNTTFAREMNRGEFIHFWSGAVSTNLSDLATEVFGWNRGLNAEYHQALNDFGLIVY